MKLPIALWLWLAFVVAAGVGLPPTRVRAQDPTDTKIRLMSEALRARDAGDLASAQKALEQLSALAPKDATVQRLRAEIEAQATARQAVLAREAAAQRAAEDAARREAEAEAARRLAAEREAKESADRAHDRAVAASAAPVPEAPKRLATFDVFTIPDPPSRAPAMVDVTIPDERPSGDAPVVASQPTPAREDEADAIAHAETQRLTDLVTTAQRHLATARELIRAGRSEDAVVALDVALADLPLNTLTQGIAAELKREKASALVESAQTHIARGDFARARAALEAHDELATEDERRSRVERQLARAETSRVEPSRGPAALAVRDVPARELTRAQLIDEVGQAWQRPAIYQDRVPETDRTAAAAPLLRKLNEITLPHVQWTRAPLTDVVAALGAMAEEYDTTAIAPKGINVVLLDPTRQNPAVTITLRNATLKRVLDFVTESVGYQYEVQADAVVVRPGGESSTLDTAFFPIARATVLRMTGAAATASATSAFSSVGASNVPDAGATSAEAAAMKGFLQQAGVSFAIEGSSLAYDGSAIIVTQTPRNLERIRNILARYNDVRQVEIEAKFMEVQEGALEELGVQWNVTRRGVPKLDPATGQPVFDANGRQVFLPQEVYSTAGVNRTLSGAFGSSSNGGSISITGADNLNVPFLAPVLPGAISVGSGAAPLANISGFVGEFDVNAVVRALSQKQGTDLLSSPKVTVLSGNPASITVAQEMRYPQSYGEIQSQVGTGSASGGGSAGVAITAGTPQEFTSRNVGVELKVTPTVEEDDYSISLDLNPKVTEFDGFVEYGGPSVAISGGTTVTVPPGFFQPIFSVRDISTRVTIWDGATLIMGGLTREEVKKVDDKIPVLGSIPLVGRLFRTTGESTQKRNLLIFVTANLVSPGGAPKKQSLPNAPAGALFQNPGVMTPAGIEQRGPAGAR